MGYRQPPGAPPEVVWLVARADGEPAEGNYLVLPMPAQDPATVAALRAFAAVVRDTDPPLAKALIDATIGAAADAFADERRRRSLAKATLPVTATATAFADDRRRRGVV